jgi:hypothetical protein
VGDISGWAVTRPEHGQLGIFWLDWSMSASAEPRENCSGGDRVPNQSSHEATDRWLNSGDQFEMMRHAGSISRH